MSAGRLRMCVCVPVYMFICAVSLRFGSSIFELISKFSVVLMILMVSFVTFARIFLHFKIFTF